MRRNKRFPNTTMLDLIGNTFGIQITCWTEDDYYVRAPEGAAEKGMQITESLRTSLEEICGVEQKPFVYYETDIVFWGAFSIQGNYFCFGPVIQQELEKELKRSYVSEHRLGGNVTFTRMSTGKLCEIML